MIAPRWHILGAGAIGCLFASAMARAGLHATLLLRDHPCPQTSEVRVDSAEGSFTQYLDCSAISAPDPICHLLVCTKAYDVEGAIAAVRHRLNSGCQILLLVNGMGLAERVARMVPDGDLFCGTTTEGAYRKGVRHICHAGQGTTQIGSLERGHEPDWFAPWTNMELRCQWHRRIAEALWHKLAINCAINPLSALNRCPNGELAARRELREQVAAICNELAIVSEASGFPSTAASIHDDALRVIRDTSRNRSSMLQDVLNGQRTEIDFITGYLLEQARHLGVNTPVNTELFERIAQIDR